MGLLDLKRLMSMQQERRQIRACDGSVALLGKRKSSPCRQDGSFRSGKVMRYSGPELPEDIWRRIHSLMPLRDAARAACISRAFLRFWRCHPVLTFDEKILGLNGFVIRNDEIARHFTNKVDRILKNHSGVGVKIFKLWRAPNYNAKDRCYLDSWLKIAVTTGMEELAFYLSSKNNKYKFPCSLLSDGNGDSIRCLYLGRCSFHPTTGLGCLRSLTSLNLSMVRTTEDELGCFLSNSLSLERLVIRYCSGIICLKIPCLLQRLSYLEVLTCTKLKVIESKAPNLSSFVFTGDFQVQLSLGEASPQVKEVSMDGRGIVCYACTELGSIVPNLETLTIESTREMVNTPMASSKFLHLKYLKIRLTVNSTPSYDYFSLVSFIEASPSLETLILDLWHRPTGHVLVFRDPSALLRQMPEQTQKHGRLRTVEIFSFSSAKSLVELTRHVVPSAALLKRLVLDTRVGHNVPRCSASNGGAGNGKCIRMERDSIVEAFIALLAVDVYIRPEVPSRVKFSALSPCTRCHVVDLVGDHPPQA